METTKKFRILGSEDAVNTCDCCGKTDLKATWAVEMLETGEILHYGSVCVTRNTGIKHPVSAAAAYQKEQHKLATIEFRQTPEYRAREARFDLRNSLPHMGFPDAYNFVKAECDAASKVAKTIQDKYRLTFILM